MTYPSIDPVAFHVFSWPVYWYGLMYLFGFLAGWILLSWRLKRSPRGLTQDQLADLVFYTAMGAIIGGRIGYMLFYDTQRLFTDPLTLFQVWNGGMSFHGGLLGVMLAIWLCSRKIQQPFLVLTDLISSVVPIGLGAGRIGNFINGELWGRVTDVPWGMVFPAAGPAPRHPSQLYEFAFEGVVLFIILWIFSRKPRPMGAVTGLFALLYSIFRFIIEFYREPDVQIGYLALGLTEGQWLTIPLMLLGIFLLMLAYKGGAKHETISNLPPTHSRPRRQKG